MGQANRRAVAIRTLIAGVVLVAAVGCGNSVGGSARGASGGAVPADFYGYGPTPDPNVALQPDVVMIKDGPKAIRDASGDGLTWTMDSSAPGVGDLKVGSVMMASSLATGRVTKLDHQGGNTVVTLAPASLTDIVQNGDLKSGDVPVDFGQTTMMYVPDMPAEDPLPPPSSNPTDTPTDGSTDPSAPDSPSDTSTDTPTDTPSGTSTDPNSADSPSATTDTATDPGSADNPTDPAAVSSPADSGATDPGNTGDNPLADPGVTTLQLPRLDMTALAAMGHANSGTMNILNNAKASIQIGNWTFEPYTSSTQIRIRATYGDYGGQPGLKVGFNIYLDFDKPHMSGEAKISNGQMQSSTVNLSGLKSIGLDLSAGAANGSQDNTRFRVEMPIDFMSARIPMEGVPATVAVTTKFVFEFGFGSKNSTLKASGLWNVQGTLSSAGQVALTEAKSLIGSMTGIGMAGTALVLAFEFKDQIGVGIPLLSVGPYLKLVLSAGFNSGSALGFGPCDSISVLARLSFGAGIDVNPTLLSFLKNKLGPTKFQLEKQIAAKDIYKQDFYKPHVNMCNPNK